MDNTAGVLTDISGSIDTTDLNRLIETGETTVYEKRSKTYIVGLADSTCSIGGKWQKSLNTVMLGDVEPATRSFEFGPEGTATDDVKFSGECILGNFSLSVSVSAPNTWSGTLQITGDLVVGVYA